MSRRHLRDYGVEAAGFMSSEPTDAVLLDRLRSGHPDAGRQVYERFSPDVNRVVWRYLRAPRDHEDVVQQVFLKVFTGFRAVRSPDRFRSWIVGVAVNTAKEAFRARRALMSTPVEQAELPELFETDFEARSVVARFYRVLAELSEPLQTAFILRYVDGRTLPEVAEILGCSLATAKRRLAKAEGRFVKLAGNDPLLAQRLRTSRWKERHDAD